MDLHFVDLHACAPQPWRNGGGRTRELLAWPRANDWRLRVSVARIEHSGPFSAFPGIWRGFTVLQGQGVTLDLPGGARTLTPADDPIAFDGEAAPMCHLLDGPTEDLNLMARREAGSARLRRARPGDAIEGTTRWRGVYAHGRAHLDVDDHTTTLHAGTLVWSDGAESSCWRLHGGGPAWFLTLED
ncbi:MAG TPA: HutD family protein [Rubrivivax sp.]|nr:HutD family protein [Rubrivivax sp.]